MVIQTADKPWGEVLRSPEVLDFLPWALLIAAGCAVAAALLLIPLITHARLAGRDDQSLVTPRNLLPLQDDPSARVSDRVRDAVVQFDLPADLRPEQMAVLLHDGSPERAIAAGLLDLESQGFVRIDTDGRASAVQAEGRVPESEFQRRLLRIVQGRNTRFEWRDWALSALYADATQHGWFTGRPDYTSYGPRLYAATTFTLGAICAAFATRLLIAGYWTFSLALYAVAGLFVVLGFAFLRRRSALGIAQHLIGVRDLLEHLLGLLVAGIFVRVILHGLPAVGLLQVIGVHAALDAEQLVVVVLGHVGSARGAQFFFSALAGPLETTTEAGRSRRPFSE